GYGDRLNQAPTLPALQPGSGSLVVQADSIDLIGNLALQGLASVTLAAQDDIRLSGLQEVNARALTGSLQTLADLTLSAEQIYPTTLTSFEIDAGDPVTGTIRTLQTGVGAPVLSAGGSLTLSAAHIDHGGTLRAPLGTIALKADDLSLRSGSVLSTS